MRPTTIQPITRAAMLRPKTQLRTADSGKGSITVSSAEDPRSVAFYMVRRDRSVPLDRMCSPLTRLEQLKRLPADLVIVFVELFGARMILGAEM